MATGTSYNGWPGSDNPKSISIVPFGDARDLPFPGGVKAGDVWSVLGYVAVALHTRVEPCVAGWDWGYSWKQNANNPSQLSCHASGTAIDWNAPDHPNGSGGTFSDAQRGEIYRILDEVQGAVAWLEGYDEMHFEICVDLVDLADVADALPNPNGSDDVTDDDIDRIADAVIGRLKSDKIVSYNKVDAGSGKETQTTGSVTNALGSAATYAGRAAYRATKIDNEG